MPRRSAMQAEPTWRYSLLEMVPEPMTVPAHRLRVRAACAISSPKLNPMPAVRMAELRAIPVHVNGQLYASVPPAITELIRRHRHGREAGRRLGLQEAEAGLDFAARQYPQAPVVDQHEQADVRGRRFGAAAHGYAIDDDADFALEVHAILLRGQRHVVARARGNHRRRPGTSAVWCACRRADPA